MKFEDWSQEEIERQKRCARGDAWRLAKNILELKETDKATFFSLTNEWCFPAPSVINPEEREFVVDSGASMHMLSRKDLNSAELETVRVSKSVKTTPQKTRFRDVKYARIWDTDRVDDHSDKNTIDDTKHKTNTKHNTKPNNVCSD